MTDAPDDNPDIDIDAFRARLEARRKQLSDLQEASAGSRAVVELDQQSVGRLSRMDALQGQAMAMEQDRRRSAETQRIDAALARIDSGDYGYCIACDEPIARARLDLDPAIPTCVDCAGRGDA